MKTCPSCHAEVVDEAKFCNKCGFNIKASEEQNAFCIECGARLQRDSIFCIECGKKQPQGESTLNSFDFSSMEKEAEKQLDEEIKARVRESSEILDGVLLKYHGNDTRIVIPDEIRKIGQEAFSFCKEIVDVVITDGVTSIGQSAFLGCDNLASVTMTSSVTSIEACAFSCCFNLKSIKLSSSIKSIECAVFSACSSLKEVFIPAGVTSIVSSAFSGCDSLERVNIPVLTTEIGGSAFDGCKALRKIEIPNGVKSIGNSAFRKCLSLEEITIPNGIRVVERRLFMECKSLKRVNLPYGLQKIDENAFYKCESLSEIYIPPTVTEMGNAIFDGCDKIKSIKIPKSVNSSCLSTSFFGCTGLEEVVVEEGNERYMSIDGCLCEKALPILYLSHYPTSKKDESFEVPEEITYIMPYAFNQAQNLASVKFTNPNIELYKKDAFHKCAKLRTIYVPKGSSIKNIPENLEIIEY